MSAEEGGAGIDFLMGSCCDTKRVIHDSLSNIIATLQTCVLKKVVVTSETLPFLFRIDPVAAQPLPVR
jgi:hypothetical protein